MFMHEKQVWILPTNKKLDSMKNAKYVTYEYGVIRKADNNSNNKSSPYFVITRSILRHENNNYKVQSHSDLVIMYKLNFDSNNNIISAECVSF